MISVALAVLCIVAGVRLETNERVMDSNYADMSADEINELMVQLSSQLNAKEGLDSDAAYLQVSDETDASETNSTEGSSSTSSTNNSTNSTSTDSSSTNSTEDSVTVTLSSDEDGYATVDVNDSEAEYADGEQATYNYTVSIYEDDDDLEVTVDDYSTSEESQNITTTMKKAADYLSQSEYELADAYDAYYEAKEKLTQELGEFKEAVVYAEDIYVRIVNYDSDADNYQTNDVTYVVDDEESEDVQEDDEDDQDYANYEDDDEDEDNDDKDDYEGDSDDYDDVEDYDDEDYDDYNDDYDEDNDDEEYDNAEYDDYDAYDDEDNDGEDYDDEIYYVNYDDEINDTAS